MKKVVDGELLDMTDAEITQRQTEVAAALAEANNRNIKSEIAVLESSITSRRIREAILGTDSGWLASLNTQITTLRQQLT